MTSVIETRPKGTPTHVFTIRISQEVYDMTLAFAKRNLWALNLTVEKILGEYLRAQESEAATG